MTQYGTLLAHASRLGVKPGIFYLHLKVQRKTFIVDSFNPWILAYKKTLIYLQLKFCSTISWNTNYLDPIKVLVDDQRTSLANIAIQICVNMIISNIFSDLL